MIGATNARRQPTPATTATEVQARKAYVSSHHELLAVLEEAVNEVAVVRPLDPWRHIAAVLLARRHGTLSREPGQDGGKEERPTDAQPVVARQPPPPPATPDAQAAAPKMPAPSFVPSMPRRGTSVDVLLPRGSAVKRGSSTELRVSAIDRALHGPSEAEQLAQLEALFPEPLGDPDGLVGEMASALSYDDAEPQAAAGGFGALLGEDGKIVFAGRPPSSDDDSGSSGGEGGAV